LFAATQAEDQRPASRSACAQTAALVPPVSTRLDFVRSASSFVPAFLMSITVPQQLFQAGVISAGKTAVANGRAEVFAYCDEVAQLGFHRYEVNNTRVGIAQFYALMQLKYAGCTDNDSSRFI